MEENKKLPTITIGCPISNRKYLIKRYLKGIYEIDYPKDQIKIYFVVNNCEDSTEVYLHEFKTAHQKEYLDIKIETYKMSRKKDKRVAGYRNEIYKRLAELRNYYISQVDSDYFFSVDSDVIVSKNVLKGLLEADKDIIAAVINNDSILKPYNTYPNIRTNLLIDKGTYISHYYDFPINKIVEVDYTGAVYLMTQEVCKNVKYDFDKYGEDIPFCRMAKEKGYGIYAHTGLWQKHIMCEYMDYCIENKCQNPCVPLNGKEKVYMYKYIDNVFYHELIRCPRVTSGECELLSNQ